MPETVASAPRTRCPHRGTARMSAWRGKSVRRPGWRPPASPSPPRSGWPVAARPRTARRWRPVAAAPRRPRAPRRRPVPAPRSCASRWWPAGCRTCGTWVSCPDGQVLVTEREGRLSLLSGTQPGATVQPVRADLDDVYARGEGGLMGMVVHPDFAQSRRFTTCQTHAEGGSATDVRLVTWQLSADGSRGRPGARPAGRRAADQLRPAGTPAAGRRSPPTARCWSAPGTPRAGRSRRT